MNYQNTIKNERIKRGLSQKDLGKLSGCTQQQIQAYEKGTNIPRPSKLIKIANALEAPDLMRVYSIETHTEIPEEFMLDDTSNIIDQDLVRLTNIYAKLSNEKRALLLNFAKMLTNDLK